MCDSLYDFAIARDQHRLPEGLAGGKNGSLIWGKGSVDENPVGDSAILCERDSEKVGFAFEVVGGGESAAPIDGVESPGCQLFFWGWMGQVK
jgi:hypothetical protein